MIRRVLKKKQKSSIKLLQEMHWWVGQVQIETNRKKKKNHK